MKHITSFARNREFHQISKSYLKCHYVVMNCSTNLIIDVKQPQSIDNSSSSPSYTQMLRSSVLGSKDAATKPVR